MASTRLQRDTMIPVTSFSLSDTLDCGQCFRWERQEDNSFKGIHNGIPLHISQQGDILIFHDTDSYTVHRVWLEYFDLDTDYQEIKQKLSFHNTLRTAQEYAGGIRILRQNPWETLVSFIISQNNNIPRIKGIITRLCECFGKETESGLYTFPSAERLAGCSPEDLSILRAGFRTKYILDAAQKVSAGQVDLNAVYHMSLEEGEEVLRKINGIGPKVAQCTLLYGYHKLDAFPIDTWIKKVLERYFPKGFPKQARQYAGVAQQYLFHYIRTGENPEKNR